MKDRQATAKHTAPGHRNNNNNNNKTTLSSAKIKKQSGVVLEGIFHTADAMLWNGLVLKYVKVVAVPEGITPPTFKPREQVTINWEDMQYIHAKDLNLFRNDAGGEGFRTDSDISGQNKVRKDRNLVEASSAWLAGGPINRNNASAPNQVLMGGLEDEKHDQKWDQFKVNAEKFKVKSTYNENLYTTELNKSALTPQQVKEAERLAREIEKQTSNNPHLREERNQIQQSDGWEDEEAKYGAVVGSGAFASGPSAYKPPHRRLSNENLGNGTAKPAVIQTNTEPAEGKGTGMASPAKASYAEMAKAGNKSSPSPVKPATPREGETKNSPAKKVDKDMLGKLPPKSKPRVPSNQKEPFRKNRQDLTADLKAFSENLKLPSKKEDPTSDKAKDKEKPVKKLNPKAKEFVFNSAAPAFMPAAQQQQMARPPFPVMKVAPPGQPQGMFPPNFQQYYMQQGMMARPPRGYGPPPNYPMGMQPPIMMMPQHAAPPNMYYGVPQQMVPQPVHQQQQQQPTSRVAPPPPQ